MTDPHPTSPILTVATREEEAESWGTHDLTDYLDELKPVNVRFARNLSEGLTVRFDPETAAELRAIAKEQGIGPTTLMRMWVLEHLRKVRKVRTTK